MAKRKFITNFKEGETHLLEYEGESTDGYQFNFKDNNGNLFSTSTFGELSKALTQVNFKTGTILELTRVNGEMEIYKLDSWPEENNDG